MMMASSHPLEFRHRRVMVIHLPGILHKATTRDILRKGIHRKDILSKDILLNSHPCMLLQHNTSRINATVAQASPKDAWQHCAVAVCVTSSFKKLQGCCASGD